MKKLIGCLLMILTGMPVIAAMVVSDPFTDGGRTDGADLQDVAWWKVNDDGTNLTLDVANDAVLGSALHYANTSTGTGRRGAANFSSVTLQNIGEQITLSLDFRLVSFPNKNDAFRFALLDAGATVVSSDLSSAAYAAVVNDDKGYFVGLATGGSLQSTVYREGGTATMMGGTDIAVKPRTLNFGINDTNKHSASLILKWVDASNISIDLFVDGSLLLSGSDSPGLKTYNEIAFGGLTNSPTNMDFYVDNVKVEYVPEPATLSILALGALAALRRKHRA